jgi:hypothetical protein
MALFGCLDPDVGLGMLVSVLDNGRSAFDGFLDHVKEITIAEHGWRGIGGEV